MKRAKEIETRYKSLLENIPSITYINSLDVESFTQYVSPQVEHLAGYSQKEFMEDNLLWTKILHPDDREQVLAENARTVESGERFQMEYRVLT